jgi:tetratricopeptide (TPR) repeat protein
MRTPAKRNKLLLLTFSAALIQAATAQTSAPPPSPGNPGPRSLDAPQNPASASTSATAPVDNSTATTLDYLFNHKAGEGTAAKAGADVAGALSDKIKAVDVLKTPGLDDPVIRARFETYLSLQEVPEARIKDYFDKMGQVSDTLRAGDAFGAWKILYAMSEYQDVDAGISRELANRVEAIWNTSRTANGLEQANDKLRDNIDTYDHNADMLADDIKHEDQEDKSKPSSGYNSSANNSNATNSALMMPNADPAAAEAAMMPTMGSSVQGKMQLTAEYLNLLEARAKIKLNEIREHKMDDEGKSDFANYIKTLFATHRYYHVIIGADFYRSLFNEGDYPVDMADEVNVALETNNQVSQAIEVFKYKTQQGQIAAAAEQLQEAFIGNEFHPGLQGLPRVDKEKVGDFLSKLDVLKNQLESRDFEQVENQIAEIKKVASDFDATKPLALVNGIKLESRLRLGKAKLLAQAGQLNLAMEEFQTAAEEWPGNPDLQTSASGFFNTEDAQNQSTTDFDRLVQEQNYREIFDKQLAFALAVKGDAAREQQLKDALTKVQKAEMATEKANLLVMNGDVDGAWETIESATKDWPDDMKLNKLLADLSGRSADFVSAINHAREAEAKKEMGYSLTWYVNAQGLYPASAIANDGIDRISKQILSPQTSASVTN